MPMASSCSAAARFFLLCILLVAAPANASLFDGEKSAAAKGKGKGKAAVDVEWRPATATWYGDAEGDGSTDVKKLDLSAAAYFHKVKALADTLASIGQPLRDSEFTSYLLKGLDGDYDSLVEVVGDRDTPISIRDLYARLLATEHRVESRRSVASYSEHSANYGARGSGNGGGGRLPQPPQPQPYRPNPSGGGGRPPQPPRSGGGNSSGNYTNNSRPPPSSGYNGRNNNNRPVCQLCGLIGHVSSRCYKRFNQSFLGIGNDGKNTERQVAMATQGTTPSYPVDPTWYADTGATDHLTNEMERLHHKEPYHGTDKIHTADGSGSYHEGNRS